MCINIRNLLEEDRFKLLCSGRENTYLCRDIDSHSKTGAKDNILLPAYSLLCGIFLNLIIQS